MSFLEPLRQWFVALMLLLILALLGLILLQVVAPPEQTPEMVQILLTETASGQPASPATQWQESVGIPAGEPAPDPAPAQSQRTHVVQPGDTLYDLALRYNLTLEQLIEANRFQLPNPDRLEPGQLLVIPDPSP